MVKDSLVSSVRAFSRFYTNSVGALRYGAYSLTEARVLFELAQCESADVADLRRDLDVDAGYLSRLLTRFDADGLITRAKSTVDARRQVIGLTDKGRAAQRELDDASSAQAAALLDGLTEEQRGQVVGAMDTIRHLLGGAAEDRTLVLRPARVGDYGWVVQRHGELYAREFGWDATFEALVARIVADFIDDHDPAREAGWIAEVNGERVGCIFCMKADDHTAKLRILLVEPSARGLGVGARLVDECVRFAEAAGYKRITLWTNDVLSTARRIYQRAGFTLVNEEPHRSFGAELTGQYWTKEF
ncbi:helix-turn-helix domain-containing GNAT family N-acetyltransferase [Allokutzneria sp. A3M-2-11 16]|uniref:bifunctional helix-turn-helix transcriptional regulator/GNAT family N-acetyltransferase n=1 Tax=Allokutzneria sp. A3M-2-11 16 TaxID=2962043 RepID=UPI0020B7CE07|nr:helix-turn-helix domain-containing GNAT family N-acetyltransferase [Allokutzneria sp. A3M-2-11 16]MCP3801530.1 helix-turn-helix domain-containing GNAT family N-acetyltransferase [Allokutzneria sp. A3M-2-11 16]